VRYSAYVIFAVYNMTMQDTYFRLEIHVVVRKHFPANLE